jgi:hypothetical protein
MPPRIANDIRAAVIRDWLKGKPRDTIALDNFLSSGAVSNLIIEWRNSLTAPIADALRELGIIIRKSRIPASECAFGFRVSSIIKELGVDEDSFRAFIAETYQCKIVGLQPEYIAYNTKQILHFSGSIPLSQIPDYSQEKTNLMKTLEQNITRLTNEELKAKANLHQTLNVKGVTLAELAQFSDLKVELNKLQVSFEDVQHFVRIIQNVQQHGRSVDNIVRVVSNWETSFAIQTELERNIVDLTANELDLREECEGWDKQTLDHRQKLSAYEQLETSAVVLRS